MTADQEAILKLKQSGFMAGRNVPMEVFLDRVNEAALLLAEAEMLIELHAEEISRLKAELDAKE